MFDYKKRQGSLKNELEPKGLDAFLVTNETNVTYLSGFKGNDSTILFTPRGKFFITDSRYLEEAKETVRGFEIVLVDISTYQTLERLMARCRPKKIGFESMNLPYEVAARLRALIGRVKFVPMADIIEGIRSVKDKEELGHIKKSVKVCKEVLKETLKGLKAGVSEKFLCTKVESAFMERGARTAFDPIIAFGKNSSKPHARSSDARLSRNSHMMIDLGCKLEGYCSDLTRIVFRGRVKKRILEICNIAREAQEKAIAAIRPGARFSQVDLAARNHIRKKGFGKYFGHSVGHGIGMEVHEKPSVSPRNEDMLRPGMVFTVEPAIYIPGLGGVRVEDMVLVKDKGCEILTR